MFFIFRFVGEFELWVLNFVDDGFVNFAVSQIGLYQPLDRAHSLSTVLNVSRKRVVVKALHAEPKRSESVVVSAATVVAPGMSCLNLCFMYMYIYASRCMFRLEYNLI